MEVPHKAREMHASIYSKEVATLPMELNFLLASIQNLNAVPWEAKACQWLLKLVLSNHF